MFLIALFQKFTKTFLKKKLQKNSQNIKFSLLYCSLWDLLFIKLYQLQAPYKAGTCLKLTKDHFSHTGCPNKAFVGLGSCDNVQIVTSIFKNVKWPRLQIKRTGPSSYSVQLVHPASPSSWSIQLVRQAGLSSWSVQLMHLADLFR